MNITIISGSETGGAGESSINLHKGFLKIGVESNFLSKNGLTEMDTNFFSKFYRKWLVRKNIKRNFSYVKDVPAGYDYFTFARTGYQNIHKHPLVKNADIINIHWVSNMIDYKSFFKNINKPIIWTLHDTNSFTGGCHYSFQCDHYQADCADCMQLAERVKGFAAKENLQLKKNSLKTLYPKTTIVISPSKWLKSLSEKSSLFKRYPHFYVPYGIDTEVFRYHNMIESRRKMGLPPDTFIVLFVGTSLAEHRKGFDIVLKLKEMLNERTDITFMAAGKNENKYEGIINLGYLTDKKEIALAYNAANVFLIPSREDNLPNTMLESLCCGTPVIGFKTGGIIDAINHGENGFLVDKEDVTNITKHIFQMVNNPGLFERDNIANVAREKYTLEKQAGAYRDLIDKVLVKAF